MTHIRFADRSIVGPHMIRHPVLAFEPEPAHMACIRLLAGVGELVSVEVVNITEDFAANVTTDVPPGPFPFAAGIQRQPSVQLQAVFHQSRLGH